MVLLSTPHVSGDEGEVKVPEFTDNQLQALADLSDGKFSYGISIRGRRSLPSLVKRGMVGQYHNEGSACEWRITAAGQAAFSTFGTVRHLRTK